MTERARTTEGTQQSFQIPYVRLKVRPEHAALARRRESKSPLKEQENSHRQQEAQGVYVISVAARLLEMHPQTLRKYERLGLIRPARTIGMLRLYSEEDIQKLRLIRYLEETLGLNLAGVEWALSLVNQLFDMHRRLCMVEKAERLHHILQQEMNLLFQVLNLPLEESTPST